MATNSNRYRKPPPDIVEAYMKLEERVQRLEAGNRIGYTTIDSGTLEIKHGVIKVTNDQDVEVVRMGYIGEVGSAGPSYGVQVRRNDGSEALRMLTTADGSQSYATLMDRQGNFLFSDDNTSGQGIAEPHISYGTMNPSFTQANRALFNGTTSSTYGVTYDSYYPLLHPKVGAYVLLIASDSTTKGQAKISIEDVGDISPESVATNSDWLIGAWQIPGWGDAGVDFGQVGHIQIQAKRTSGTGTFYAIPYGLWGEGS